MGSFSNRTELSMLDHFFGTGTRSYTSPTCIYIGLSKTAPAEDGTNVTEPSSSSYTRQKTRGNTVWRTANNGSVTNKTAVSFSEATATWGTITHMFLSNASTSGTMLGWATLTVAKQILSGDTAQFAADAMKCSLD